MSHDVKTMADVIDRLYETYRPLCDESSYLAAFTQGHLAKELTLGHAGWMLDRVKENASTWPVDKLHRWIGFVQAILVLHEKVTVDQERERTRPLFHSLYHREGIIPPTSQNP